MQTHDAFDQETIDEILDAHGVDGVEQLPDPVQNNLERGSDAKYDVFDFWRDR